MNNRHNWNINIKLNLTEDESKKLFQKFENWINLAQQDFYKENRYLNPDLTSNLLKQTGFTKIRKTKYGKVDATKNNKRFYGLFITDEKITNNGIKCTFNVDKIEE
jgi:hypothetical protein